MGTRTRALVISQFPLVDLDDWKHAGHREERLEDLEPAAARAVLRGWGVQGDDATLDRVLAPLADPALVTAALGAGLPTSPEWPTEGLVKTGDLRSERVARSGDRPQRDGPQRGLAAPLGYHALSVAVLGSYLGKLWGGDPTKAPTFDRCELAAADPKAAKPARILTHYAQKLPDAERDLLRRLSTFPRGVTVEFLGFLIDAGGEIAAAELTH